MKTRTPIYIESLPASVKLLANLASRRKGGQANFLGIEYQLRYSIYKALTVLEPTEGTVLRLEGIEDVDVIHQKDSESQQFYQLKFTTNKLNASDFIKLGLLRNFLEAYLIEPNVEFILVTNQMPSDVNVAAFESSQFNEQIISFWKDKIEECRRTDKRTFNWDWSYYSLEDFLSKIRLTVISEQEVKLQTNRLVVSRFDVNNQTEDSYFSALFYLFFVTSSKKGTITYGDVLREIKQVRDNLEKGRINPAIQQRWLERIEFKQESDKDWNSYFDGKAALPIHIALNLPVTRSKSEKVILDHLLEYDCAVIRASSGQGKSTLAWLVSKKLHDKQTQHIYQLHHCSTTESVGAIVDFLESRIKIFGQAPLVIIDGLSISTAAWTELARRLIEQPVKFLVTTRQEDWFRFGRESYQINLGQPIDISFTDTEAKHIYTELKRRKKIYSDKIQWQIAWEKVKDSGLLIEYVYLLTRGEMLQDRLGDQIRQLNLEVDGAIKLHILRIIALADTAGVRVHIHRLLEQVQPQTDPGLLLEQLEKEYSLRFDEEYVEGLHPVRSAHLNTLLHKYVPHSKTLLNLFDVIDNSQIYQLGVEITLKVHPREESIFYQSLAKKLVRLESEQIVSVLNGLYHGEIVRYWQKHQDTFDSVFDRGGFMLLPLMIMPFPHPESDLSSLLSDMLKGNAQHLISAAKELPPLTIQQTVLGKLLPSLSDQTNRLEQPDNHIGHLLRWFHLFNIPVPLPSDIQLLDYLKNLDSKIGAELAEAVFVAHSDAFRQFAKCHIESIISWLKVKTNTLTIVPSDSKITIEYLLTDSLANKANDESVGRIEIIRAWLPLYEVYETNAIMLPFPSEQLISVVKQNAHKVMPPVNIMSSFTVRLNRIWSDTLERQYMADSVYSWQKQWFDLRKNVLDCVKLTCRVMELQLMRQGGTKSFGKAVEALTQASTIFFKADKTLRQFPVNQVTSEERLMPFHDEVNKIRDWNRTFSNFLNQFTGLFVVDQPEVRRLALINLRSVIHFLPVMQEKFDYVVANTWEYFNANSLKEEERNSYRRLQRTAIFYGEHVQDSSFSVVLEVHKTVRDKWHIKQSIRLQALMLALSNLESTSGRKIYHPTHIIEDEILSNAVFGMEISNIKNVEAEIENLLINLSLLAESDFDFVTVVFCERSMAKSALRFNRSILQLAYKALQDKDVTVEDYDAPCPLIPDLELISPLPNVILEKSMLAKDVNGVSKTITAIWKASEYKKRLSSELTIENKWLIEQMAFLQHEVTCHLLDIKEDTFVNTNLKTTVDQVFNHNQLLTPYQCAQLLIDYITNQS